MVVIYIYVIDILEIEKIAQMWQDDIFPVRREACKKQFCATV